jgi:hypothetical protein
MLCFEVSDGHTIGLTLGVCPLELSFQTLAVSLEILSHDFKTSFPFSGTSQEYFQSSRVPSTRTRECWLERHVSVVCPVVVCRRNLLSELQRQLVLE